MLSIRKKVYTNTEGNQVHSIDIAQANRFALYLLIPVLLCTILPFYLLWGHNALLVLKFKPFLFLILFIVGGVVLHELLHALFWLLVAPGSWRSISFGFKWEYLAPYCHCTQAMKVWQYTIGAVAPLLLMGIIPAVIALIIGHTFLLFFGMFYIWTAAGDIISLWMLRGFHPSQMIMDHPDEVGFIVMSENGK